MSAERIHRTRGPAELGSEVRRVDGAGADLPRCTLPSCPDPALDGAERCAGHIAADPPRGPRAEPMDGPALAAWLSRLAATARARADRSEVAGQHARADHWRFIERMADVLLRVEGLRARDFVASSDGEDAFLRDVLADLPRVAGSVGGGTTRDDREADEIAAHAVSGIRRKTRALLGVVA